MPETEDLFEEVKKIRWHQEVIDSNIELLTRAHRKEILEDIMHFFGNVPGRRKAANRARIFLAIDGNRTVGQIADDLGLPISYVSREITKLKSMSLIEVKEAGREGIIYKKGNVNRILRISQKLMKDFGIKKEDLYAEKDSTGEENESNNST